MTEFNPNAADPKPQEYKKDIMLHPLLRARVPKRNILELECKVSRKKWHFKIPESQKDADASTWVRAINGIVS